MVMIATLWTHVTCK